MIPWKMSSWNWRKKNAEGFSTKKQLMEIFRSYFYNAKKNKAYSKSATAAYVVLFVMLMVGVLGECYRHGTYDL